MWNGDGVNGIVWPSLPQAVAVYVFSLLSLTENCLAGAPLAFYTSFKVKIGAPDRDSLYMDGLSAPFLANTKKAVLTSLQSPA